MKGEGLLRKTHQVQSRRAPRSLPNWAIAVLRTRHANGSRLDNPIFADTHSGFRDPTNVRRSLRTALPPIGNTARLTSASILRQSASCLREDARASGLPDQL
ncbi:hypothetical protein OG555_24520 [Kribbella sp. NBC_01484]|uniref:hypothetical protein n=1 Tax=Kribbella sp. NBC_01484 TaxID=2903579 RepID=UPI002E36258D|nr:hypothetical protein [Kribbella sp. NBC_01484]